MPKHLYPRDEVDSNFDFAELMDAGRPGGRRRSGTSSPMTERVAALRRAVGEEGVTLVQARETDFDAYAADLPRLRALEKDYLDLPENQPRVGEGGLYRKASVLIGGPSRAGKDVLAAAVAQRLLGLAETAGLTWRAVKPSGEHSAEDVGTAEVAHHEDVRYQFTRSYDDALRYADPNQATRQAARNANLSGVAPRAILLTTSETMTSLALSLKARKPSDELVLSLGKYPAVNVDEFLFRLGWVVEVVKPRAIALHDLASTKTEMIVSIYRVEEADDERTESVQNRGGTKLGDIRTKHRLDPVAVIKGCDSAARFLAMSIIEEYSPDVAAVIPDTIEGFATERSAIESNSSAILERRMIDVARGFGESYAEHFRQSHLSGTATPNPTAMATALVCCRGALTPAAPIRIAPRSVEDEVVSRARDDGRLSEGIALLKAIPSPWENGRREGIERPDIADGGAA